MAQRQDIPPCSRHDTTCENNGVGKGNASKLPIQQDTNLAERTFTECYSIRKFAKELVGNVEILTPPVQQSEPGGL